MSDTLPGLLLLHADAKAVDGWVRHGVVPSYVVPLPGWTALVVAAQAQAKAPYGDGLTMTANRPVPTRLRPAIGGFVIDGRAVLMVHPRGWRAVTRYLVWEPNRGAAPAPGLPAARVEDFVRASGVVPTAAVQLREMLRSQHGSAHAMVRSVVDALALPGGGFIDGEGVKSDPESVLVEPGRRAVERFDKVTQEDAEVTAEMQENDS